MGRKLQAESAAAARTADSMVRVEGVSCVFDQVRAVDAASFELGRGRFLTILGPCGSGKTTLLRMIAGFVRPASGEIFIAGQPVSRRAAPQAQHRHGVPAAGAVSPYDRRRQCRLSPEDAPLRSPDDSGAGGKVSGARAAAGLRQAAHPRTLRRPAAARRHRPRAGVRARPAAAGRAAGGAGPQAARGDAARVPPHPAGAGRHHHQRHPRSAGGAGDVRRDHRHGKGQDPAEGAAGGHLSPARQPLSSPASSA